MIIDVYDIHGAFSWCRFASISDSEVQLQQCVPFSPLLIYPRYHQNQLPYLQSIDSKPIIDDFVSEDGSWSFSNSTFIWNILKSIQDNSNSVEETAHAPFECLRDFFSSLQTFLRPNLSTQADQNIILVPDHYDARIQEMILQTCGLPRGTTTLLWRSVAAVLGASDELRNRLIQDGQNVAIVDSREAEGNLTILTMKEKSGFLIPQRRSFSLNRDFFPKCGSDFRRKHAISTINPTKDLPFVLHTLWNREGKFPLPFGDEWRETNIRYDLLPLSIQKQDLAKSVCTIVLGKVLFPSEFNILYSNQQIIREMDISSSPGYALTGAARFAVRRTNHLPTYFDYREAFSIIRNDQTREEVVPEVLITEKEDCMGGEEYIGKPIRDTFYVDGANHLDFLLLNGFGSNTPLKQLTCHFENSIAQRQYLTLSPRMVVGQGFAIVKVEGAPLLPEPVILNFLEMNDSDKTIASLNKELKRSFPTDIPQVRASYDLWIKVQNDVLSYLHGEQDPDGAWFAKSRFPNPKDDDYVKRLERENVFGTDPKHRIPRNLNTNLINDLCKKLAADYVDYENQFLTADYWEKSTPRKHWNQTIRLIAWTYQADNPCFREIKKKTFTRLGDVVNCRGTILPQEYTLCAHFANCKEDYNAFFDNFIVIIQKLGPSGAITNWLRTFFNMLILHNDMLEFIPTHKCEKCVQELLDSVQENFLDSSAHPQKTLMSLRILLFLLKRRRYDNTFLRQKSVLWKNTYYAAWACQIELETYKHSSCAHISSCVEALIAFLEGKGTIEGLPKMIEDADKDED